jgi:SAM-dependent methyltransferase/uncharacterized protein YbaR (Trm112 family)
MDLRRLDFLCCPTCPGSLQLDPKVVEPRFAAAAHASELLEGFLTCDQCPAQYPVVAGVLLLPEDIKTYLSSHYALLLTCAAAEGVLGLGMLQYLRAQGYEFIELNQRDYSYGHQALYVCAHYDDLAQAASRLGGPFADYLATRYENFYDRLFREIRGHLDRTHVALDLAGNVGGMVYRLAPCCAMVFGVDTSFSATLTARKLLFHQPSAQTSYGLPIEGRRFVNRPLSLVRPDNVELLVASGTHLPFPDATFDLVTCLSLLDCLPDPAPLIASIRRVLRPGGILMLSDPYAWTADSTPVKQWLGEDSGQASALALKELLAQQFEVLWEQDAVPWILREHGRFYQVWLNHCLMARKTCA